MRGSLCISIDVELAWGAWDRPDPRMLDRCAEHERSIVSALVELFERHEVRATWAIVARLLELDESKTRTTRHGSTVWYAPDVVECIQRARVPQDIGSHSYSHIYFGESTRAAVRDDLAAAHRVHTRHSLPFSSFVFPRNQVAHLDLLREFGVDVYRGVDRGWAADARRLGRVPGRLAHVLDQALPIAPEVVESREQDGLANLPGSMLLMGRNGIRRMVIPRVTVAKVRRGLESACRMGRTMHLWFHPSNFYFEPTTQLATVSEILEDAVALRKGGRLDIRPMCTYAPRTSMTTAHGPARA